MPLLLTFTVPETKTERLIKCWGVFDYNIFLKTSTIGIHFERTFASPQCILGKSPPFWCEGMLGEFSLFSHSTRNERAKLFGGDRWPLNWAATSWLCICKTLKRINIVMHSGFTGPQMNALLYARTFGSFISLRTTRFLKADKNMQMFLRLLPKHLQELLFFPMSRRTPQSCD